MKWQSFSKNLKNSIFKIFFWIGMGFDFYKFRATCTKSEKLSIYLSIYLFIYLSIDLSIYLSIYLYLYIIYLYIIYIYIYIYIYISHEVVHSSQPYGQIERWPERQKTDISQNHHTTRRYKPSRQLLLLKRLFWPKLWLYYHLS